MVLLFVVIFPLLSVMPVSRMHTTTIFLQLISSSFFVSYAFVEYEDSRDASDAYHRLHGKPYRGGTIRLEWAKRGPETRRDRDRSDRRIDGASTRDTRGRSRSPRRSDNEDEDRKRDRSHDDRNDIDLDKKSLSPRRPSRSPKNRSISRSASPLVRSSSSPSSPARYDQDQI
jgi:RNA recognition motif-containing protein